MIIDADVHISQTEKNGLTAEQVLSQMDRAGVDKANIWLQPPYLRDIGPANRYVYESALAHPDRFHATGWVDPGFGDAAAMQTLRLCVEEYGMNAVKMNGAQNGYRIDEPRLFPLYEYMERNRIRLALHIGADFYDFTHPSRAKKVSEAFPDLKILMVHMGGAGKPDLSDACIEVAQSCRNMLLVGSAISYLSIMNAIRALGPERVCFGSDAPFALIYVERAMFDAFLPDVTNEGERRCIMGGNIAAFLDM